MHSRRVPELLMTTISNLSPCKFHGTTILDSKIWLLTTNNLWNSKVQERIIQCICLVQWLMRKRPSPDQSHQIQTRVSLHPERKATFCVKLLFIKNATLQLIHSSLFSCAYHWLLWAIARLTKHPYKWSKQFKFTRAFPFEFEICES